MVHHRSPRTFRWIPLALALAVLGAPVCAAQQADLTDLRWLSGCWTAPTRGGVVEEQWTAPAGGLMLGVNRSLRDGQVGGHEFLRIRAEEDGLVYHAIPSGQAPTDFGSVQRSEDGFAVANPDHDFPQRIVYERVGEDGFVARVYATVASEEPAFELAFTRSPCPAGEEAGGSMP
jgi:hypothetical protein